MRFAQCFPANRNGLIQQGLGLLVLALLRQPITERCRAARNRGVFRPERISVHLESLPREVDRPVSVTHLIRDNREVPQHERDVGMGPAVDLPAHRQRIAIRLLCGLQVILHLENIGEIIHLHRDLGMDLAIDAPLHLENRAGQVLGLVVFPQLEQRPFQVCHGCCQCRVHLTMQLATHADGTAQLRDRLFKVALVEIVEAEVLETLGDVFMHARVA